MIPAWLIEKTAEQTGNSDTGSFRSLNFHNLKGRYIQKGIKGAVKFTSNCLFNDQTADKPGWLQQKNAGLKLLSVLLWIIALSLTRNIIFMASVYLLILVLVHKSLINLRYFLLRVWLVIPLFTIAIALPAIFNFITPGPSLFVLVDLGAPYSFGPWRIPQEISITTTGLRVATVFICRVAVSVSAALLFSLTTKWHDIFRAMRLIRVPQAFVLIFSMSFRYIQLLLRTFEEMHLAKKSRTIFVKKYRDEHKWVGFSMATLFSKSLKMSDDIHRAMISRGYNGEMKTLSPNNWTRTDYLWLTLSLALVFLALKSG